MRILGVTFRYGKDVYGGAEAHMKELAEGLRELGAEVDICTTKSHGIRHLIKSGELWDNTLESEEINGVRVIRLPVKNPSRYVSLILEKLIQAELDKEERASENKIIGICEEHLEEENGVLLTGWNQLERYGSFSMRWTKRNPIILIKDKKITKVSLTISNRKRIGGEILFRSSNKELRFPLPVTKDWEHLSFDFSEISGKLLIYIRLNRGWKPLKDFRTLGISVSRINYVSEGIEKSVDLENDYRKVLIKNGLFVEHYINNAGKRADNYGKFFDYMRGPRSPEMAKWLDNNVHKYDIVIAQMLPFNTLQTSLIAKKYDVPLILLPLMHIDDEFYHWKHYYETIKKGDMVLANSSYSKTAFYDRIGAKSTFVGPGVSKETFFQQGIDPESFRSKYKLENKRIILTVSRKNPGKRYDILIKSMERIDQHFKDAHMVMIGPDDDKLPVGSVNVSYLGKVSQEDLVNAYEACEVFVMMSESESFGMVFCEAWTRKKPVIGNLYCGAVSSLIDDGKDGFLCGNEAEVADRIEKLLNDRSLAAELGENGLKKVLENHTWDIVTKKVMNICKENLKPGKEVKKQTGNSLNDRHKKWKYLEVLSGQKKRNHQEKRMLLK
ncbi:glycosyltransferase [Methanosarcina hadiensis]|uniref:glycosyltransferase n=1 Tax=Methanosarcina hadiensis TaxID=3078083 RepID=UPI003977B166